MGKTKTVKKLVVKKSNANSRLDIFVSKKLKLSRSQIQKMIEQNIILTNNKLPKKPGDRVKENDVIEITPPHSNTSTIKQWNKTPTPSIKKLEDYKITVIGEASDYVVINKPTGLLVHPTQAGETNTLVAWLVKKYPEIKTIGDPAPQGARGRRSKPNVRPGIVHRLDKEASGLLVIARTQPMFDHLKNQFKSRTIEKEYWALVHGKVAKDWDEINFPIARSENFERMAARPFGQLTESGEVSDAKDARTEFLVEKRFVNFTLLKVILHTGRMHQIRAHLLAYNHPLVGDPLYFQKKRPRKWDKKLGRLFLHSTRLSFTDLDGQRQTFESPLPQELRDFLNQLS